MGPFFKPTDNKGIEERLDRLHILHLVIVSLTVFAIIVSIVALVVAVLAWRRPVAPPVSAGSNNQPMQTLSVPVVSGVSPTNTQPHQ